MKLIDGIHHKILYNVSRSPLSVARHTKAIKYKGVMYHYLADDDTLIRDDVYKQNKKDYDKRIKLHHEKMRLKHYLGED